MTAAAAVYARRRSVNDYHFNYGFTQFIIALSFVSVVSLMMKIQNAWSWSSSSSSPFHQYSPSWTKSRINNNQIFLNVDDNTSRRRRIARSRRKRCQTDTPSSFTVSSSTSLFSQLDNSRNNDEGSTSSSSSSSSSSSKSLSYDDTDAGSKGLVGGLTAIINSLSSSSSSSSRIDATTDSTATGTVATRLSKTDEDSTSQSSQSQSHSQSQSQSHSHLHSQSQSQSQSQSRSSNLRQMQKAAPSSSEELLERLRRDYTERNYLWTGDLDIDCFADDCRFTDPTISFVGTDAYSTNTQNLVPIVDAFVTLKEPTTTSSPSSTTTTTTQLDESAGGEQRAKKKGESILLSIKDNPQDGYIETRWNMVGTLDKNPWLFWKPTIDVIGRTKFWYKKQRDVTKTAKEETKEDNGDNDDDDDDDDSSGRDYYQVWFYDEEWEIPAYRALLQLITPTGTIS